ncbi:MAG: hypothetical protein ABR540_05460 [Acidimicrobiales bacterium]
MRLFVRLVSEGKWTSGVELETKDGYTLWGAKGGGGRTVKHYPTFDRLLPALFTAKRG